MIQRWDVRARMSLLLSPCLSPAGAFVLEEEVAEAKSLVGAGWAGNEGWKPCEGI